MNVITPYGRGQLMQRYRPDERNRVLVFFGRTAYEHGEHTLRVVGPGRYMLLNREDVKEEVKEGMK